MTKPDLYQFINTRFDCSKPWKCMNFCWYKNHSCFCSSLLNGCISRTSDKVNLTNKFELTPHMTLIKVNRPIARLRKSKYLPSALYENHNFDDFGIQEVDNLQLCVIEDTTRADGFYRTLTHLSFSWKILTAIPFMWACKVSRDISKVCSKDKFCDK